MEGNDKGGTRFKIECYGTDDRRVLRYFDGAIIREPNLNDYFASKEEVLKDASKSFDRELELQNNENWHIAASTICMASGIWVQKSNPVEWEEARTFQQCANQVFSKANMLLECLQSSQKLKLKHTVSHHEINTQLIKYAIHSRNKRLQECSDKTKALESRVSKSLKLQLEFLRIVSQIRTQFKVLINARNAVDVSTVDVDYPASFSVFVVFYDAAFNNENSDTKIWEVWDLHKRAPPTATQQCLVSYYENADADGKLETRITFPTSVSYFIQNEYAITINGAHVPVYSRTPDEEEKNEDTLCYRLKKAQMCLIDRLIFTTLCQRALDHLRAQRPIDVGDSMVYVKSIHSEKIVLMCKLTAVEVSYTPTGNQESGDVKWRLLVTKLRDIAIQNWKRQVYMHQNDIPDMLMEFLQYAVKLISRF